ncbi:MAG: GNAT family N-acetyltransferase [Candidatus Binataceae bacterium]
MAVIIRAITCDEAGALTELALRSKAHWGYDAAFMADARKEIALTADDLARLTAYGLELSGRLAGFYALRPHPDEIVELHDLWMDPEFIGQGHGTRLWLHALAWARSHNFRELTLIADPNAESFYLRRGASTVSYEPSGIRANRRMPVMRFEL